MRLDHIAWRTFNRHETASFFIDAFGYKVQEEFEIFFDDEKKDKAICIALEPPEKEKEMPYTQGVYHLAPEIFVSEGTVGSIVHNWVVAKGGPGIHHFAYQVESVEKTMQEWQEKGWAEFSSEKPFKCEGLTQIFTKPMMVTGIVFEFIERDSRGFCKSNVLDLMRSTDIKA